MLLRKLCIDIEILHEIMCTGVVLCETHESTVNFRFRHTVGAKIYQEKITYDEANKLRQGGRY